MCVRDGPPIRRAQRELQLGRDDRIEALGPAALDLSREHVARRVRMRRTVRVDGVGEHDPRNRGGATGSARSTRQGPVCSPSDPESMLMYGLSTRSFCMSNTNIASAMFTPCRGRSWRRTGRSAPACRCRCPCVSGAPTSTVCTPAAPQRASSCSQCQPSVDPPVSLAGIGRVRGRVSGRVGGRVGGHVGHPAGPHGVSTSRSADIARPQAVVCVSVRGFAAGAPRRVARSDGSRSQNLSSSSSSSRLPHTLDMRPSLVRHDSEAERHPAPAESDDHDQVIASAIPSICLIDRRSRPR